MLIDLIDGLERTRLRAAEAAQPPPGRRADARGEWNGDAAELERALRASVRGEVRFDDGSRALYATDASNYRQVPIGVVIPRDADDVVAAVAAARAFDAPILARGGGTSLAGQCCNVAVVIDFSKYMNRVIEIDAAARWARVEPGIVLDVLRAACAPYGLWFGPDPATHSRNTLGGMIGNNSCGMHAQFAGKTEENTLELEILTYGGLRMTVGATTDEELDARCAEPGRPGEIYTALRALRDRYAERVRAGFPQIPRRVSGYPLDQLLPEHGFQLARALVGTESTCVLVLSAKLKLIPNPAQRCIVVLGFDDVYAAGDRVPDVNRHQPIALEGLDDRLVDFMQRKHLEAGESLDLLPEGAGWLMAEFGDVHDRDAAIAAAKCCEAELLAKGARSSRLIVDPDEQHRLWEVREAALGATAKIPNHRPTHPGWEDSAVPPDRVGAYLRDLRALFDRYGYDPALYGHFGQGCIHCRVDFDLETAAGVGRWRDFLTEAAHLVTRYGGSLSGEHGDGQARGALLAIMYGSDLVEAFRAYKRIWDPDGRMNPGKVVDAYPVDSNLREGPNYRPWRPATHFSYESDDQLRGGSFAEAANRCVGVGLCRRHDGKATMCPSYRVTKEEQHSTRGRARLLFEMLEGEPLRDGWRSDAVKDALDLCLACKGCKGDCPVNVDMATYKAEFLAHYYETHPRPIWAYAFGLIPWWAHLAAAMPRAANALAHAPLLGELGKRVVRMAPQRRTPVLSEQPFRTWWRAHRADRRPNAGARQVLLWPDTFTNAFHAPTAVHAVEVLEAAGYDVVVPERVLCCGRPLYDYGMVELGKTLLREVIAALRPQIEAGTPLIALEPSCASAFRDELISLFPDDPDARRLAQQTTMLGDFLAADARWSPPQMRRRVVLHGHCHQKATFGLDGDRRALERIGAEVQVLDDGCCGMAGAFGFEAGEHYDVSIACGELAYLPAVRDAQPEEIVIGGGFSCREQAQQTTPRQALHLADVLWLALQYGAAGPPGPFPERAAMPDAAASQRRARRDGFAGIVVVSALCVVAAFAMLQRKGKR
ncbi:MAG TPA: FAD-binding and (Fe-S)-binding domain-containing protein [Candidatus Elarobacter sp.]